VNLRIFRYAARTANGVLVTGMVRAESPNAAAIDLQRRALVVTTIKESKRNAGAYYWRRRSALHGFYRSFAVLLRSGVVLRRALGVAIAHCKERELQESLSGVLSDVEQGSTLSAAMARRPREFPALHTAMIGAGELGGVLDEVLERIAALLDRDHIVRKRIESALAYPALVASAAACVVIFLVARIVPMFAGMFQQLGARLPMPTRVLLSFAKVLNSPALPVAMAAVGLIILLTVGATSRFGRERLDRFRLGIPVLGSILRMAAISRIARMLGMLLRCGVSILPSIDAALPLCGSALYAAGLRQIGDGLRRGEPLHLCMTRCGLFNPLLLALVAAGDETGTVDKMLLAAADYLDVEVEAGLTAFAALVEPALISFLGLIVGFIVFSIFLPLYALIGSLA
jgi:type IV pilus assembly protein PilC